MSITNLIATFDDVSLTSIAGVSILATNPYRPAKRTLSQYLLARTDKRVTASTAFTSKLIAVRVAIHGTTRADAETKQDSLLALLQGESKELVLSQGAGVRKYFCTYQDYNYVQEGGAYLELDLIFSCDDSFGYDTAYTTALSITNVTSSTRGDQIEFKGSALWQAPKIVIQYSAVSGGSSNSVSVGNPATGQVCTITRNIQAGDRIEIDTLNRSVTVNGMEVEFDGAWPEWQPKVGNWSYSDTLTTRTFSATITYYKRYV